MFHFFFKGPTFCCQGCHVLAIVVVVVLVAGNIIIVQLNFSTENRLLFYRTASVDAKNRIKPDQPCPGKKSQCNPVVRYVPGIVIVIVIFRFVFRWGILIFLFRFFVFVHLGIGRFLIAISPDSRLHDLLRTLSAALNGRTKGNWCRRAWKMHFPKR